jgi:hypothetical protein
MAILAFRTSQVNLYLKGKRNPAELLTDKTKRLSIKKHGILLQRFHLLLWETTIIYGIKKSNLVQVQWSTKKGAFNSQTMEGIAYQDNKN